VRSTGVKVWLVGSNGFLRDQNSTLCLWKQSMFLYNGGIVI
jgi:hypothetical protein